MVVKNKFNLINFGYECIYEGEVIKSLVTKNKIENITIINSCSVTEWLKK